MTGSLSNELEVNCYLPLNKFVKYLKETAPQASISYPTALKLVNEGKIKAQRVGSQLRINRVEIDRWIKQGNYDDSVDRNIPKNNRDLV